MFCGLRSLRSIEGEGTPKSRSPKVSKKKEKANKNPYSTLGLDKFSAVLDDLKTRRARIMADAGRPEDASTAVWFTYNESKECVPVVVRLKGQKEDAAKQPENWKPKPASPAMARARNEDAEQVLPLESCQDADEVIKEMDAELDIEKVKTSFPWCVKEVKGWSWRRNWRPRSSYCWPLVMVLILLCLLMFGRAFAVCCTSIWWYMVPTMQGDGENERRSKKKDHGRRMSNKSMVAAHSSPAKKVDGVRVRSPRGQANGRKCAVSCS